MAAGVDLALASTALVRWLPGEGVDGGAALSYTMTPAARAMAPPSALSDRAAAAHGDTVLEAAGPRLGVDPARVDVEERGDGVCIGQKRLGAFPVLVAVLMHGTQS